MNGNQGKSTCYQIEREFLAKITPYELVERIVKIHLNEILASEKVLTQCH